MRSFIKFVEIIKQRSSLQRAGMQWRLYYVVLGSTTLFLPAEVNRN